MPATDEAVRSTEIEVADFQIEDLLMSRTDDRGVIRSGNATFSRLSGFGWDELLDAPHKILRHRDMPKGVFHLCWQYLAAGKCVGVYLKNRSKTGSYYWVFAIIFPASDGFFSVQLKPSGDKFSAIRSIYGMLLEQEKKGDISPAESEEHFLKALSDLGYANYSDAMADFAKTEIDKRRVTMRQGPDDVLDSLGALHNGFGKIGNELQEVRGMFENIRGTPSNLRIQASRFGEVAVTIQVISQNYDLLTREIEDANGKMSDIFLQLKEILDEDAFGMTSVVPLLEGLRSLASEKDLPDHLDVVKEAETVRPYIRAYRERADVMLKRTEDLVTKVRQLQRIVSGLAVTRVMCRIEAAGLSGDAGGIVDIVDRLLSFQTSVMGSIERIDVECRDAHQSMLKLAASFSNSSTQDSALSIQRRSRSAPNQDRHDDSMGHRVAV